MPRTMYQNRERSIMLVSPLREIEGILQGDRPALLLDRDAHRAAHLLAVEEGLQRVVAGAEVELERAVPPGIGDVGHVGLDHGEAAQAGEELVAELEAAGAAGGA